MTRSEKSMDLQEQELAALDQKLLRSVSEKKPSWAAELLEQGADPDAKFSNGVPAVVQAATDPCKEVMQALLAAGADACARTQAGMSALMWAVIKDPTMIPMLIDGSDPDAAEREHGWTALMYAASKLSDLRSFEALAKASDMERLDSKGRSALMIASERSGAAAASMVKAMLDLEANPQRVDAEGDSALDKAIRDGSVESALCLAAKALPTASEAAKARARELAKRRGLAALSEAVERGCGAQPSMGAARVFDQAQAMLIQACESGSLELAREALRLGAKADGAQGSRGEPLVCAVQEEDPEMVKLLIRRGADPKVERHGMSPLSLAAAYGSEAMVKILLPLSDPGFVSARGGATAMHEAAEASVGVLDLIIVAGGGVDAVDFSGNSPLARAASRWNGAAMVERLLAAGASLWPRGAFGESVGERAARLGSLDSVAMLAKAGAYRAGLTESMRALAWAKSRAMISAVEIIKSQMDAAGFKAQPPLGQQEVQAQEQSGSALGSIEILEPPNQGGSASSEEAKAIRKASSLMWRAAKKADPAALGQALGAGADPREFNEEGQSPLAMCCLSKSGNPGQCAKLLIAAGGHPLARDGSGRTPMMLRALASDAPGAMELAAFGGLWSKDGAGDDALSLAASVGAADLVEALLAKSPKADRIVAALRACARAPKSKAGPCANALAKARAALGWGAGADLLELLGFAVESRCEPLAQALVEHAVLQSAPEVLRAAQRIMSGSNWPGLIKQAGPWADPSSGGQAAQEAEQDTLGSSEQGQEGLSPVKDLTRAAAIGRKAMALGLFESLAGPESLPSAKALIEVKGRISPRELAALANEADLDGSASSWAEAGMPKKSEIASMGSMLALVSGGRSKDVAKLALAAGKCVLMCGLGAKPWDGFAMANVNGSLEAGSAFERCQDALRAMEVVGWPMSVELSAGSGEDGVLGATEWLAMMGKASLGNVDSEDLFEQRFWEEISRCAAGKGAAISAKAAADMRELVARELSERPSLPEGYPLDLADAPGLPDELRSRLMRLATRMSSSRQGRGILLHGSPGVGKTMLARLLAKQGGRAWVHASLSEWAASDSLGPHLQAMRASFERAIAQAPSVMFLDELDSIGSRSGELSARNQLYVTDVVNALLDWVQRALEAGVWVVSASNHPEAVDQALTRPGRLGEWIEVPEPGQQQREQILAWALPGLEEPGKWARALSGASPAALREAASEALCLASERGGLQANDADMEQALGAMRSKALRGRDISALRWPMALGLCAKARAIELGWDGLARVDLITMEVGADSMGAVSYSGGESKGSGKQAWIRLQVALAPAAARVAASREQVHGQQGAGGAEGLASLADLDGAERSLAKELVHELARMGMGGRALAGRPWDCGSWFEPEKAALSIMESAWEAAISSAQAGMGQMLLCAKELLRDGHLAGGKLRILMGVEQAGLAREPSKELSASDKGGLQGNLDAADSEELPKAGAAEGWKGSKESEEPESDGQAGIDGAQGYLH